MFPSQIQSLTLLSQRQGTLFFLAKDPSRSYYLKCAKRDTQEIRQAYSDEYTVMSALLHPSIPLYYGYQPDFCPSAYLYDFNYGQSYPCLCMEYCQGTPLFELDCLKKEDLLTVLSKLSKLLCYLLDHGVLYLDLNPSNILVAEDLSLTLLDYSFCYYFIQNPDPSYNLGFSYDLQMDLPGRQLLAQELSFFAHDLINHYGITDIPSSLYVLLESGLHPNDAMTIESLSEALKNITNLASSSDPTE